jgi:(1->4)-alpha-D-glucan 1-alpha-D-glucosylmutase
MTEAPIPRATYRLQFHAGFRFADAAALASYLADLGVSHVYASPWLKARPGSRHGYDLVDHASLNPELGDEADFRAMCGAFRANGLGQILDFVPNHMGVGGADNPWWLDVLEWGEGSDYAGWFDIDWDPDRRYLHGKLLVPILGAQYGAVLEAGELALRFDSAAGRFDVWAYGTHRLPICPLQYARILGDAHAELERLGDAFSGLPDWRPHVARHARDLQAELAALAATREDVRAAIDDAVSALNGRPGELDSWRALDALIQDQHWRVAHFRVAADDINYRRFFNINELAGVRMELPELFAHAHGLVFALLADGTLDGLRIDHVDGLLDPKGYLNRLRELAPRPFYLVVEKILSRHEALREDWPVQGTTGYEFANLVLALQFDPAGEAPLSDAIAAFAGPQPPFAEVVQACKRRIMANEMASELNVLARDAARIARQNPRSADFTRNILHRGLQEIVAAFPVYRTYVDGAASPTEADLRDLDWAVAQARKRDPDLDPSVFDFLRALLSTELIRAPRSGFSRHAVTRFAMRLQQYSGPVMAKGLEDTAFYRWHRLVALNEVGGHPDQFGTSLPAFHRANAQRAKRWPDAMLATSTHDTKRGEDVRARLAVLSELPEEWSRQVQAWSRILRARRGDVNGSAPPDRSDEYLLWQLLLGAWPAELTGTGRPPAEALRELEQRLAGAMVKSLREARLRSGWAAPDLAYEQAVLGFLHDALDADASSTFFDAFLPFQARVARLGVENSLVQTALKLTLPGMPDLYQGAELWDLSLVDPDNRRPVDFGRRATLLEEVRQALRADPAAALREMLVNWQDGRIKLALTAMILDVRRRHPALFARGEYVPVAASGAEADRICAFLRRDARVALLVVARRFPSRGALTTEAGALPAEGGFLDILTGRRLQAQAGGIALKDLLSELPTAVLLQEQAALIG